METNTKNPFIVGDWIKRDEDFIGRQELIQKYLSLDEQFYWLIGARRMGKTSLLRYLQRQFQKQTGILPLFWDVSGANTAYDLKLSFLDSLESAEEDFFKNSMDLDIEACEENSIIHIFRWLIRECQNKNIKLILLIDESEALFNIAGKDALFLNRFKAILFNSQVIHLIIASNHGINSLNTLDFAHLSAPFLQPFLPPDYLEPWTNNEALTLISRCSDDKKIQDEIITQTGCLPFLVQMTCFNYVNVGSLHAAIDKINNENILDIFFRDDFNYFDRNDINILINISHNKTKTPDQLTNCVNLELNLIKKRLFNLVTLGFLKIFFQDEFSISNEFLRHWIELFLPNQQKISWHENKKNDSEEEHNTFVLGFNDRFLTLSFFRNETKILEENLEITLNPASYEILNFQLTSINHIGQQIFHDIFGNNKAQQIYQNFSKGKSQKILICNRKKSYGGIPFELMHNGFQFLVLTHELSRTLQIEKQISPLKNLYNKQINILLIASNTPPGISNVDNEIIQLKNQLQKIKIELQLKIEITAVLSNEANYQTVENLLHSGRFHFFHYAGHVGSDANTRESYLYFWEKHIQKGRVKSISASELGNLLCGNIQFIYFNSCNSAKTGNQNPTQQLNSFVDAAFKSGAKTFIGNILKADDSNAALFAIDFYWQLFLNRLDVSKALFQTRKKWSQKTLYQEGGFLFWLQPVLWEKS